MPAELKAYVPVRLSEASIAALLGSEQDVANRFAELEAERPLLLEALWILLDGREVVVLPRDGTRSISITKTDDGGFLIRRAREQD